MRLNPRGKRWLRIAGGLLITTATAWYSRGALLGAAGSLIVTEDALSPAEVMVVSNTTARATALEAAILYKQQVSARLVMTGWVHDPLVEKTRELGIPYLDAPAINKLILERSGVPSSAITVLPDHVDGTSAEIAAIADFAARGRVRSLLVITARSHTARTKWLLRRALPHVRISVRSSRYDRFRADGWWRERDQSREMLTEYLRFCNSVILRDVWSHASPRYDHATARESKRAIP